MAPPVGYLVHAGPGRLRIKLPECRDDRTYFAGAVEVFQKLPGVTSVQVSPLTGGLLLHHTGSAAALVQAATDSGLFRIDSLEPNRPPIGREVMTRLGSLNEALSAVFGRPVDIWSVAFIAFSGLALLQLARGRVMAPAITMVWYAVSAALYAQIAAATPRQVTPRG